MPNWCHNRVTFHSDNPETLKSLRQVFDSDHPFSTLIPEPDWPNTPNEQGVYPGPRYRKFGPRQFPDGSFDQRWYDWRCANWGVKWDIQCPECTQDDDDLLEYEFETPWGPPHQICNHLKAEFPDLGITWFYDEPGCQCAGYL